MRLLQFVACLIPAFCSLPALCRAPANCDVALFQRDYSRIVERDAEFVSFLLSIDERNYEEAKHSASANVPGYFDGTYDDFSKKRSRRLQDERSIRHRDQARDVLTSTMPAGAMDAWRSCVIGNRGGLYTYVASATDKNVTVVVGYVRPIGVGGLTDVKLSVNGLQISEEFGKDFEGERGIQITRKDKSEVSGVVNATVVGGGTFSHNFFVPEIVQWRTIVVPVPVGLCTGRGGQEGVQLWGPLGETCNNIVAWGPYLSPGSQPTSIASCKGHGGFEGVTLWGPAGQPCGGIPVWGTYSANSTSLSTGEICGCIGRGNILEGHLLWGPKGASCGGFSGWGTYTMTCKAPTTQRIRM